MAMVYFTMVAWLFQYCAGKFLLALILESPVSIQNILRSDGGGYTFSISRFWPSTSCSDDIRRSLCRSSYSEVIRDDLEVLKGLFQNQ